jgi:hypothetical protein
VNRRSTYVRPNRAGAVAFVAVLVLAAVFLSGLVYLMAGVPL